MESPPNGGGHLLGGAGSLLPGGGRDPGFGGLPSPDLPGSHHAGGGPAAAAPSPPPLPGFGAAWSVQAASPPPAASAALAPPPSPEASEGGSGFYAPGGGLPSSLGPAFLQSFSAAAAPPAAGPFGGPFSPAPAPPMPLPPPPSRRSPASPQQHQAAVAAAAAAFLQQRNSYNHHQPLLKPSPWSNLQSGGWSPGNISWGGIHSRDHRRNGNMGIPGTANQVSPLKKPFSGNVIAPPKFSRSASSLTPKPWTGDNVFRTDNNSNPLLPLQC